MEDSLLLICMKPHDRASKALYDRASMKLLAGDDGAYGANGGAKVMV